MHAKVDVRLEVPELADELSSTGCQLTNPCNPARVEVGRAEAESAAPATNLSHLFTP